MAIVEFTSGTSTQVVPRVERHLSASRNIRNMLRQINNVLLIPCCDNAGLTWRLSLDPFIRPDVCCSCACSSTFATRVARFVRLIVSTEAQFSKDLLCRFPK